MSNDVQASLPLRVLLRVHGLLARRVDMHRGLSGRLYRHAYFLYKRITDRGLLRSARACIVPGSIVLDIGANIGFFSCVIARNSDVHVLAFEPDPKNFAQLQERLNKEKLADRVQAYPIALSDTTGVAKLYISDLAPTDHKLIDTRSTSSVEVTTKTLDQFMNEHPRNRERRISLIKIDVQGAELMVLRGMHQTLKLNGYPPILVEYSPSDLRAASVSSAEFFHAFAELGYRPYTIPRGDACSAESIAAGTRTYTDILMRVPSDLPE